MQIGSSRAIGEQKPIRAISGKRTRLRQLQQNSCVPQGKLMLARYYGSAGTFRFTGVDPTAQSIDPFVPQSWNRYSYVRNEPIGRNDPTGRVDNATIKYDHISSGMKYGEIGPAGSPGEQTFRTVMGWCLASLIAVPLAALAPEVVTAAAPVVARYPGVVQAAQEYLAAETGNPSPSAGLGRAAARGASLVDDAARGASAAYEAAAAGGRHAGLLKNYAGRSAVEIQKGLTSLERQAALHGERLASPAQFAERWGQMSAQEQAGLLRYWQKEAARYQEQADVLRGLLGGS